MMTTSALAQINYIRVYKRMKGFHWNSSASTLVPPKFCFRSIHFWGKECLQFIH